MTDDNKELFPRWRHAVELFLAAGFSPGSHIEQDWFYEALEFPDLKREAPLEGQAGDYKKRGAQYMTAMGQFTQELNEVHGICLRRIDGFGHEWVKPEDVTGVTERDFDRGWQREVKKAITRLHFSSRDGMTQEQLIERNNSLCRVAWLNQQMRESKKMTFDGEPKLPGPEDED